MLPLRSRCSPMCICILRGERTLQLIFVYFCNEKIKSKHIDLESNRSVRSMKMDSCARLCVARSVISGASSQPEYIVSIRKIYMFHDKHFIILDFFSSSEMLCIFLCCFFSRWAKRIESEGEREREKTAK